MKLQVHIPLLAVGSLLITASGFAQDPSSKPNASVASTPSAGEMPAGPGGALKDILAAACSQNQTDFTRYLTARNKEAFSRMTPAARVALMKRFVLLNEPGKASATLNASGRLTVRCETPSVTTEMQIGGAEIRDNIAFLPMELRDVADSTGESARQISMGLVREAGEWKLLSLGVLFLDLPALEAEWNEAEIEDTEKETLQSLKDIVTAIESYRKKYFRLPESLANLGQPLRGALNNQAAGLLDSDLVNGVKNGYAFRYVIAGASSLGAPAKYELSATPLRYGQTGRRSFFRDSKGGLHAADHQGAVGNETDPKAE
jgi:hypothetical protein